MKEREICMIERRKKVQGFIEFVQNLGIMGIFIATAIEAAAIPFPCTLSILLIGSVSQPFNMENPYCFSCQYRYLYRIQLYSVRYGIQV